jgi:hypothetical protein
MKNGIILLDTTSTISRTIFTEFGMGKLSVFCKFL